MKRFAKIFLAAALFALPALAQSQAHKNDFDYLVGDWEFTAENAQFGKFHGLWSAARMPNGQILDEYRITGDKGESYYVTWTVRSYDAKTDQWDLVSFENGNGLHNVGTGRRDGDEVHIEQHFGYGSKTPTVMRIRYFNIQPDRFSWAADLSKDEGRTWTKDYQKIEAKRIGPARNIGPLTNNAR